MRRAHCDSLAAKVALLALALAALDLRMLALALAHRHCGESQHMLKLAFPLRVACAPTGVPCLHELTVAGPAIAFEPGELWNKGRWGDGGKGSFCSCMCTLC